jgi:hypothetical protein
VKPQQQREAIAAATAAAAMQITAGRRQLPRNSSISIGSSVVLHTCKLHAVRQSHCFVQAITLFVALLLLQPTRLLAVVVAKNTVGGNWRKTLGTR